MFRCYSRAEKCKVLQTKKLEHSILGQSSCFILSVSTFFGEILLSVSLSLSVSLLPSRDRSCSLLVKLAQWHHSKTGIRHFLLRSLAGVRGCVFVHTRVYIYVCVCVRAERTWSTQLWGSQQGGGREIEKDGRRRKGGPVCCTGDPTSSNRKKKRCGKKQGDSILKQAQYLSMHSISTSFKFGLAHLK